MYLINKNPEKLLDFDMDIFEGDKILITGATGGIGRQLALKLAEHNLYILIHGRNEQNAKQLKKDIEELGSDCDYICSDFSDIDNIKKFSDDVKSKVDNLDYLVNCAGEYISEERSASGYEYTFIVNYLSTFIISLRLLTLIKNSGGGRIINVGSEVHRNIEKIDFEELKESSNNWHTYSRSKLFNIMFSQVLDSETSDDILVNCVDPGFIVDSKLFRNTHSIFNKLGVITRFIPIPGLYNSRYGASMILYSMYIKSNTPGSYYCDFSIERPSHIAENTAAQDVLWKISQSVSGMDADLYVNNFEFSQVTDK